MEFETNKKKTTTQEHAVRIYISIKTGSLDNAIQDFLLA